jgi:hypothetical protein
MRNPNPYVDQLMQKGYTAKECSKPAKVGQFPKTIHGRIFKTEEEYREAIADFLNGN